MSESRRHSIGIIITDEDMEIMSQQIKLLKRKTGWSRNDVLRVVCMRLLTDDEFIEFMQRKGNLKKRVINYRKRK